ncbi:MAG: CapA family protein [Chloroflexi bacterium]|nr:CapA family protein [Chloroflexota bacterium]
MASVPQASSPITLMGVGDVIVNRPEPESIFTRIRPVLQQADIVFGNCETTYSERGSRNPIARGPVRSHPRNMAGLTYAGFHVMSFANNHHLDWGYDGFFDTLELLRKKGIQPVGAGKDLAEARTPAIVTCGPTRVAFLAYAPVTFLGYEAGDNKPGSAPMRIYTYYRQVEHEQPGTAPDILTFADPLHLEMMREDIQRARSQADVVVLSFHWGLHFTPATVAMYESQVGRAAIDAGADLVLGHHQHILKGTQVYKGKAIFHGLGLFAIDAYWKEHARSETLQETIRRFPEYAVGIHDVDTSFPFHPEARQTLIAKAVIRDGRIERVAFLPCMINREGQPEPCPQSDDRFQRIFSYVSQITRAAGFETKFEPHGDEVLVAT